MQDILEIKKRIDIVEFAEALGVEVMPNRRSAKCFNKSMHNHGDSNPSLHFKVKENGEGYFKCFACSISGSIVDLLAEFKGISTTEAIREIQREYGEGEGVKVGKRKPRTAPYIPKPKVADKETKEIYQVLYETANKQGMSKKVKDYLTGDNRGLTEDTIKRFKLFSMDKPEQISQLLQKDYSIKKLVKAGLFAKGKSGYYFRFNGYPVGIPYLEGGEIVYIKARRLDSKSPKYMQVGGLSLPLFNRDILKEGKEPIYICEGEFDTIITAQNGYSAVGIVGVNGLKSEIIEELIGLEVILAFDNDKAGQEAVKEVVKKMLGVNVVGQIDLPEGVKDLTEFFIKPIEVKK